MIPNISTQQEDILKPGDQTKSIRQDQLDINLNEIPSVNSSINEYEPPPISGIEGIYTDPSKKVLESSNDHGHSEVAFSKSSFPLYFLDISVSIALKAFINPFFVII